MSSASIEDIEKEIDEILSKAEEKKMKIIGDARRRAEEIKNKPIPTSAYELEAEEIIKEAEKQAKEVIKEAERKAEEIKNIDEKRYKEIVEKIARIIAGVK
ncbi:MAG: hypothetical protein B6U89_00635 [Desulfurococcales archaeon ex4484_58]|nr:MAG: hypothetical protein B6U89_00635 [Desulfurococcales archaeon ex4484_58]